MVTTLNPDLVLLVASALWAAAALVTGLPHRRIPSEFPFLFSLISACAAFVGFGDFLGPDGDTLLTIIGVLLFTITPVIITIQLFRSYPPQESAGAKTVSDGGQPADGPETADGAGVYIDGVKIRNPYQTRGGSSYDTDDNDNDNEDDSE